MMSVFKISKFHAIAYSTLGLFLMIAGCSKEASNVYDGEPIAIIEPAQNPINSTAAGSVNYSLNITTDKNIDSVSLAYHIDSTGLGYNAGDALNYDMSYKPTTLSNVMKIDGVFKMPSNVKYGNVVRLVISMRAKDRLYSKQLRIDVR
ncbi:MAG: hypothetical protein KA797_06250 [Chitinophagales bacterium]|nr:hypothetical protein [Chitinophagales bacterium]